MPRASDKIMFKVFLGSCAVYLLAQGHFVLQGWLEKIPFTDSWAYYRNYHPIRHDILVVIKWGALGLALLLAALLVAKRTIQRFK